MCIVENGIDNEHDTEAGSKNHHVGFSSEKKRRCPSEMLGSCTGGCRSAYRADCVIRIGWATVIVPGLSALVPHYPVGSGRALGAVSEVVGI